MNFPKPKFPTDALSLHYHHLSRAWGDEQFDPAVGLIRAPKYVREFASNNKHFTRDSLYYARVLLDSGEAVAHEHAVKIIEAMLAAQVKRDGHPMRGNYPWFVEDGEDGTWDPNFACFCAQAFVEIWHWYRNTLPPSLVAGIERSLALSAEFDLKRWVSPAYNNIALMTVCSLACGGDILRERKFSEAGREKLRELMDCVDATGAFEEYNCPTYFGQNLRTLSTLQFFLRDKPSRSLLERLWRMQWKALLDRTHLPTGQLAGPHGRAYGRDMRRFTWSYCKFYLHRSLGEKFSLGVERDDNLHNLIPGWMIFDADCPEDLKTDFLSQKLPRTVTDVVDSCDFAVGLPESRRYPPLWRAEGSREKWREWIRSKGSIGENFHGATKRATTYLGERFCFGTTNVEVAGVQPASFIAHWPQDKRADRGNYLVALGVQEKDGKLIPFGNSVLCVAQNERRALGLLRFGLDEERNPVRAERACFAFQVNRDAESEIFVNGKPHNDKFKLGAVVAFRSNGIVAAVRVFAIEVPNAKTDFAISEADARHSHAEGEIGAHLTLSPLALELGQEAFVAFAFEIAEETECGGVEGITRRLSENQYVMRLKDGRVKLSWKNISLETSVKVMDFNAWATPEGAVCL